VDLEPGLPRRLYPISANRELARHPHLRKPRFKPGSNLGRLASIIWTITAWTLALGRPRRDYPDVIVIGTDPPLSIFTAFTIRRLLSA